MPEFYWGMFPWGYIHAQESVPTDGKRHAVTYNMCRALLLHDAEATEFTVCNANLVQMAVKSAMPRKKASYNAHGVFPVCH